MAGLLYVLPYWLCFWAVMDMVDGLWLVLWVSGGVRRVGSRVVGGGAMDLANDKACREKRR